MYRLVVTVLAFAGAALCSAAGVATEFDVVPILNETHFNEWSAKHGEIDCAPLTCCHSRIAPRNASSLRLTVSAMLFFVALQALDSARTS